MNKRILISCPVRNRDWVIPDYLECLYKLDYDKKLIDIYWIVNNSNDNTENLLREFRTKFKHEYNSITIEKVNNNKIPEDGRKTSIREQIYPWLAFLRNKMLSKCVALRCDYLFSSDCDIMFTPDTLKRLLAHNLPVVSCLIWNGAEFVGRELAYKYPNILREVEPREYRHICTYRIKNPQENPVGTLLEVEYTGAIMLVAKEVCAVAKFNDNLKYGEDEGFCWSARQAGYKLYCDISLFQQHIMFKELLEDYHGTKN